MNYESPPRPFVEYEVGSPWTEPKDASSSSLSSIYFRAGSVQRVYYNNPYNILSLLGDLGGLFEILMISGAVLTFIAMYDSFESSLLN